MTAQSWQWWATLPIVAAAALFVVWHIRYGRKGC